MFSHAGGIVGRYSPSKWADQEEYAQPRALWKLVSSKDQELTIKNLAGHLGLANKQIQQRQVGLFAKMDEGMAKQLEQMMEVKAKSPEPKTMVA